MNEQPFRVLLVEDNPGDARIVTECLAGAGGSFDITPAESLTAALDLLASDHFDVILLDLELPDSEGLDTFTGVSSAAPDDPIIVLTGLHDETLAHQTLRQGAQDYLVKGTFDSHILERSIRYSIERRKAQLGLIKKHELLTKYLNLSGNIFVVINADQKVSLINSAGCEILGYSEDEMLGRNWFDDFLPQAGVNEVKKVFDQIMSGDVGPVEYYDNPVKTKSGETRLIAWHNTLLRDDQGKITGTLSSGMDITEREHYEVALTESEYKFRSVAESAVDAVISVDSDGIITFWNHAAESMFGYPSDDAVGNPLTMIMPERFRDTYLASFHKAAERKVADAGFHREVIGLNRSGEEIPIELSVSSWHVEDQTNFTAIIRDISERKAAERKERLRNEESRFLNRLNDAVNRGTSLDDIFRQVSSEIRELFNSYGAMVYLLSGDKRYLVLQKSMLPTNMYGIEKVIGVSLDKLDLKIDLGNKGIYSEIVENRQPFITNNSETIQEMMGEFTSSKMLKKMVPTVQRLLGIQSVMTAPLIAQDKTIGLLDVSGQAPASETKLKRLRNLADQLSLIIRRRMIEDELAEKRELLEDYNEELLALYEVSTAIGKEVSMKILLRRAVEVITSIRLFDIKKKAGIILVNGEDMELCAYHGSGHTDEFLEMHNGMKVGDCLCGLAAQTGEMIISRNSDTDDRHSYRYTGMRPHGHVIVPLKTQDRVVGVLYLYTLTDVEIGHRMINLLNTLGKQLGVAIERARLYEETRTMSLHDPLTGLANRNLMNIELQKSFAMARRFQRPFSVIMLDLDHFKKYNDTYGHTAGDHLLQDIAKVTMDMVREIDLVVRFGGEEFLLILPDTDLDSATEVAERIRHRVEGTGFFYSNEQPPAHITVSLGVAMYEEDIENSDTLITRADNALYEAKFKGRNRVEVSPANNNKVSNHD